MASNAVFARDSALFNPRLTFTNSDGSPYALAGTQTVRIFKQDGTLLVAATAGSGMTVGSNYIDLAIPAATMAGLGAQYLTVQSLRTDVGPIDQGSFTVRCLAPGEPAATDISGVVAIQFGALLVQVTQINASQQYTALNVPSSYTNPANNDIFAVCSSIFTLSAAPQFVMMKAPFTLAGAIANPPRISFDGITYVPIKSPTGGAPLDGEIVVNTPYLLSVTSTAATISMSGVTW